LEGNVTTRSLPKYRLCPICDRLVLVRKDGALAKHSVKGLKTCPGSWSSAPVTNPDDAAAVIANAPYRFAFEGLGLLEAANAEAVLEMEESR
jgi:hypothetical protein